MKRISHLSLIIATGIIFTSTLFGGGPLSTVNGKPVRFKSNILTYQLDRGGFGIFTNKQARDLANASFKVWDDVASSNVTFQHTDADTLPVDVNGTNFLNYTSLTGVKIDGLNPIVFDSDGSITEALFGAGSSASVIGFAYSEDTDNDGYLDEGESFMNGKFADGSVNSFSLAEWKSTFVHEFGHFLGLDHTQINGEFVNDAAKTIYIPTMYPTSTADDVPLGDLNPDDIAAISFLYPEPTFATSTGKISGSVTRENGSFVRGANVIAISAGADSLMNQVSTITDYYIQYKGDYTVVGLAPGSYNIRIEPIDPSFTGGSSVGPYAYDNSDTSFINPVTPEFYNGANESGDPTKDDPNAKTPVTVTANATTSGINIIANSSSGGIGSSLLVDDFSGTAGTQLVNSGWTISGTATVNPIAIVQPGLTFSGYASSGVGNAVILNTNGQDIYNTFKPITSGTIYLSFMMKVDSAKTGDYFIALSPSTGQTNYYARTHIKSSGAGYLLGISKYSEVSGGSKYGTTVLDLKKTYLVVVKYEFISGATTNDQTSVFVFPTSLPSTEPATKEIDSYTNAVADPANLGDVTLRQGSATAAPYLTIDGIRVGTGWPGTPTSVSRFENGITPSAYSLTQNYPNPFNPTTVINYQLPMNNYVSLKVYDAIGREVATLVNEQQQTGNYSVQFNASKLSSGIYFYTLSVGNFVQTKKMVILK